MKKLIFILAIFFSLKGQSQNLDTVSVSLTLRAGDWATMLGKYGPGSDSVSRARVRAIRTAIIAANPPNWTTNVTINNVSGHVVMAIYTMYLYTPFGEMMNMGSNNAERTTIYNNIRAINNSALQYHIGVRDGELSGLYLQHRGAGKTILMDN